MNTIKLIKHFTALLLLAAISLAAVSCANQGGPAIASVNLMEGISSKLASSPAAPADESAAKAADFALRLFRASAAGRDGNLLVSPLSVLCALSMTANGAKGETLAQMEEVLGMSRDELNEFYRNYTALLPSGEKYKLDKANSIWFTADERFSVNGDFLQTNADYYGADIYKAAFDEGTLKDINNWVKDKTRGMIPQILDRIPASAIMYLINALAFEAEWEKVYYKESVRPGEFTLEDGNKRSVDFMYSEEHEYLAGEGFTGFKKYYAGRKYAFAALLPDEGVTVDGLIASLDAAKLLQALAEPEYAAVNASMPRFETSYSAELSELLIGMGMKDAFNPGMADFSGLGSSTGGNIFISRVIHKTFISVDELGTKAGAATLVEMNDEALPLDIKDVRLDRPFVYMLIDCETNLPFFIGTMMDPAK
ncbi:MAG: serpin family protein [Clostridia bacterium]|nr:serpin family protein [Clostridia bacterium]